MPKRINSLQAESALGKPPEATLKPSQRVARPKTDHEIMLITSRELAKERGLPPGFRKGYTPAEMFEIKRRNEQEKLDRKNLDKERLKQMKAKYKKGNRKTVDTEVDLLSKLYQMGKLSK